MNNALLEEWRHKAFEAKRAAHRVLAGHETAPSRVIHLEEFAKKLSGAPVDVQSYFREALTCLQVDARRAAIVFSWSGFLYTLTEDLFAKHEANLVAEYPSWKLGSASEFREDVKEAQILTAARKMKHITSAQRRIYDGHLSTRNLCAHPTVYNPPANTAIGYVDSLFQELQRFL